MTTETTRGTRSGVASALLGAAAATLVAGLAVTFLGALTIGADAARGALVGTTITVLVFATGSLVVNMVAEVMPAASLMFALLTYTLQVAVMALVFMALSNSGALDSSLDREWLAAAVIAATMVWLLAQLVLTTRLRIPIYDLSAPQGSAGVRKAGER